MTYPLWQAEAVSRFPDLAQELSETDSPYQLWFELTREFERAYDSNRPGRVAEIYAFAKWCCEQPRGQTAEDDLVTCVAVCFFEHIPTHPKALSDMPRWWTLGEVRTMRKTFSYFVGADGFEAILKQYG